MRLHEKQMSFIVLFFKTIAGYTLIACAGIICLIPCGLIALLPKPYRYNKFFFWFADLFYKTTLFATFGPQKFQGIANIPAGRPVIFVANHQSSLDIPVLGALCNSYPHVWLALEYYANEPVLGFFIKRMFIAVDRSDKHKAARSLLKVLNALSDDNKHLLIFPEGARYTDGKVHDFFQGFAIIAKKTGYPVVPVYMPNNYKIFPPYSFLIYYYTLEVIIGQPYYYTEHDTTPEFTKKVHAWFVEQAEKYEKEYDQTDKKQQ